MVQQASDSSSSPQMRPLKGGKDDADIVQTVLRIRTFVLNQEYIPFLVKAKIQFAKAKIQAAAFRARQIIFKEDKRSHAMRMSQRCSVL